MIRAIGIDKKIYWGEKPYVHQDYLSNNSVNLFIQQDQRTCSSNNIKQLDESYGKYTDKTFEKEVIIHILNKVRTLVADIEQTYLSRFLKSVNILFLLSFLPCMAITVVVFSKLFKMKLVWS